MRENKRFFIGFLLLFTAVFASLLWQTNKTKAGNLDPVAYLPLIISPPGDVPFGPVHSGDGTYYYTNGIFNCGLPAPGNAMYAAINSVDYGTADLCGAYIEATGPKGTVTVQIIDQCGNCYIAGDVDFSPQAFAQIADLPQGRVDITWRLISPAITTPIQYYFDPASHQYWVALHIRNHRNPITKLEYWNGSNWVNVPRREWNIFEAGNTGMGVGPYTFRVTDYFGNKLVDSNISLNPGSTVTGSSQFPPPP